MEDAEEEEWGGVEGADEIDGMEVSEPEEDLSTQNGGGKKGKAKQAPTGEELRAIKDSADLFRSSSFKLQVKLIDLNLYPSF